MDADERRRTEAAMANISRMKKAVEADPAAAMQASLDASMALVKRRLMHILFWVVLAAAAAAAVAIYLRGRG
jgi:ferric-dicitrate binding protein FerR (iron transport regulator)